MNAIETPIDLLHWHAFPQQSQVVKWIVFYTGFFVEDHRRTSLWRIGWPLRKSRMVRIAGLRKRHPRRGQFVSYRAHLLAAAGEFVSIVMKGEANIDPMYRPELSSGAWRRPSEQIQVSRCPVQRRLAFSQGACCPAPAAVR